MKVSCQKGIELKSDQTSESNYQLIGYTEANKQVKS